MKLLRACLVHRDHNQVIRRVLIIIFPLLLLGNAGLACPDECDCRDHIVDCSSRGLTRIPRNIPDSTERLELQRNSIAQIGRTDFAGLRNLRKLQLNGNRISFIDGQAFKDLTALRALQATIAVRKGDHIEDSVSLLDSNRISCIHEQTFATLGNLEVLTLNNNKITRLIDGTLRHQDSLRTLRMHSNPLNCDCHLTWFVNWLQHRSNMAVFTQCFNPVSLRGVNLAVSSSGDFTCNELTAQSAPSCDRLTCPTQCSCNDGVADCRGRGLTAFPVSFPSDVTEIRLEQNTIEVIPAYAFAPYKNLRRIDISNNEIRLIEPNAFEGLSELTSLVLYSNKITSLPEGIFRDLRNLQLLLLNANKIKCLRQDVFDGLTSLTLLSLYDNKLQSMARGSFDSLRSIQTMHLAQNPFICDCNLRWLAKYLRKHPVETSGAKCAGPRRMGGKKIELLKSRRYRCSPGSSERHLSDECVPEAECPSNCRCEGSTVDCSGQGLTTIPDNIPPYAAELILSNNEITTITNSMAFRKLRNLKKIDLSNNQLITIEDGAFAGATSVVALWLNNNQLSDVRGSMFSGLDNLKTLLLRNNRLTCIGDHTFAGLSSVTRLSLYSNQVTTVLENAFRTMTSLSTLNLLSNPLNCNCHLAWLSTWLRRSQVASGNPRCETPRFLRGLPAADINPQDFRCDPQELSRPAPTCLPVKKCPASCDCEGTVVRCGNRGLTSIPVDDLPPDVTELYLEMNSISEIPTSIKQFVRLTTLDLSNNNVSSIKPQMFSNLTQLSTLILSYNRLRCIPDRAFSGLRSLRILSLHSNDLSTLPEGLFDDLVSLSNVGFGANPWYCDCNLRWFARWVKNGNLEAGIARCSGPRRMEGRLILASGLEDFLCQGPLDIAIAVKCNPCLSSPCQHDSICSNHPTEYYQCACQAGFKGKHCEMAVHPCILKPCKNGARCNSRDETTFTCECQPGFEGTNCEINIDDCSSNPCQPANSTCLDGINEFKCQCPPGWEGSNCDQKLRDICSSQQPCLNGGTCTPIHEIDSTSYKCDCLTGFKGVNCSQRFDPCLNHKCENGGQCEVNTESPTGYQCNCVGEFSGQYCHFPAGRTVNILQDDPCSQHDCQNGGQCHVTSSQSDYECRCLIGYEGPRCENLVSLSFHKNGSYVEMTSSLGGRQRTNVTIFLSTTRTEGVVLYNGDSRRTREHIAIELYSGHVRLSYNFAESPGSLIYSRGPISDGRRHRIEVLIRNQVISLKIDNEDPITESIGSGNEGILDVRSSLYLGGLSSDKIVEARRMWHIRNVTTFIGCIETFYLNEVKVNFMGRLPEVNDLKRDVRPGCVREGYSGSCSAARCDQGTCVFEAGKGVVCRCFDGYTGDRCEQTEVKAPPCQESSCDHGSCVEKGSSYFCRCEAGYSGERCSVPNACHNVKCGKGRCVLTSSGYQCKCKKHYTGQHCQKRIRQCPGKRTKDYHRVSRISPSGATVSCRSRRRITNLICDGTCSIARSRRITYGQVRASASSCCRPSRSTQRTVRMMCSNRTSLRLTVHRIRRCTCQTSTSCT